MLNAVDVRAAEAASAGPSWLAITLAVVALLGTLGTALSPVLVERIKQGRSRDTVPATPTERADAALTLVQDALDDLQAQRDQLTKQVAELQKVSTEKDVRIALLEAELGRLRLHGRDER